MAPRTATASTSAISKVLSLKNQMAVDARPLSGRRLLAWSEPVGGRRSSPGHGRADARRTVPGGASRETWLVEGDGGRWVLRRDPEGSVSLVPIAEEFALIEPAARGRRARPGPLALEPAGGRFGIAGMLMSLRRRDLRCTAHPSQAGVRARPRAAPAQLAEALARIHSIDPAELDGVLPDPGPDPAVAQIEEWERQLDEIGEPLPAVELGLRWLRANAPEPAEPRLVHGDFRLGNFIVDEDGLAAVIDWELAHLGDPAEDIGWLCIRSWRFGNDDRRWRASAASTNSSPPTRRREARRSTASGCATGRPSATSSGRSSAPARPTTT